MFVNFNFYFVILNPNTKVPFKINNHQKRKKRNDNPCVPHTGLAQ